jgi:hypothetical protein
MSGTSWAPGSSRYNIAHEVGAVLKRARTPGEMPPKISADLRFARVEGAGAALALSGSGTGEDRMRVLDEIVDSLARPHSGKTDSVLSEDLLHLPDSRQAILLVVGSYVEANRVAERMNSMVSHDDPDVFLWRGRVCRLVADDDELDPEASAYEGDAREIPRALRLGDVSQFMTTRTRVLVVPLLSIERGHNIMNNAGTAAFSSVYFLVRPFPHPDSIDSAVHSINDWISRKLHPTTGFTELTASADSLEEAAQSFRKSARAEWWRLLNAKGGWKTLGDRRPVVTWDLLVVLMQVIGRLLRGDVGADVHFVDAAFAPHTAAEKPEDAKSSLLWSMHDVLAPYLGPHRRDDIGEADYFVAEALYGRLFEALAALVDGRPRVTGEVDR